MTVWKYGSMPVRQYGSMPVWKHDSMPVCQYAKKTTNCQGFKNKCRAVSNSTFKPLYLASHAILFSKPIPDGSFAVRVTLRHLNRFNERSQL